MSKKNKSAYRIPSTCHVCGNDFLGRYNLADRSKVCTPASHKCKRKVNTLEDGRRKIVPCETKCCRSRYRASASIQAMDQAIDDRKLLNQEEFNQVVKRSRRLRDPVGMAIRFIAGTGCRLGEALLVRAGDLRLNGSVSTVKIPTLKRGGRPVRTVDLHDPALVKELQAYSSKMRGNLLLFDVGRRTIQEWFTKILKKLKLEKDSGIHLLRHTRASQLAAAGAPMNYVRQQLGWASLEMAKIYTHTSEDERTAIAKKLPTMSKK